MHSRNVPAEYTTASTVAASNLPKEALPTFTMPLPDGSRGARSDHSLSHLLPLRQLAGIDSVATAKHKREGLVTVLLVPRSAIVAISWRPGTTASGSKPARPYRMKLSNFLSAPPLGNFWMITGSKVRVSSINRYSRRKAYTAIAAKMVRTIHAVIKFGKPYRPFFEGTSPGGRTPLCRAVEAGS